MKKLSKYDVIVFSCLMIGCILCGVMWLAETIVGGEILWLRVPASILMFYSCCVIAGQYAANVIIKIIDYFKERKVENK